MKEDDFIKAHVPIAIKTIPITSLTFIVFRGFIIMARDRAIDNKT
jgi:hypothetical protein